MIASGMDWDAMGGTGGEHDSNMPIKGWSGVQQCLRESGLYWFGFVDLTIVVQTCVLFQLQDSLFHDLPYDHNLFRIGVDAFDIHEQ